MEELGHYYTVYATSLWVGFPKDMAKRFALLAQLPDEVDRFDAVHLHKSHLDPRVMHKENSWRFIVEYTLHSLTGEDAIVAQARAKKLLLDLSYESYEFGLMLHTLGDTFAHTEINSFQLYKVAKHEAFFNSGHFHDYTAPDFPFLRPDDIFIPYLVDLFSILKRKRLQIEQGIDGLISLDFGEFKSLKLLKDIFLSLFKENVPAEDWGKSPSKSLIYNGVIKDKDYEIISKKIIRSLIRRFQLEFKDNTIMDDYYPENVGLLDFSSFKEKYLKNINISIEDIEKAVRNLHEKSGGEKEEKRQDAEEEMLRKIQNELYAKGYLGL